jgi:uroporphyrinogen-III synthase
VEFAHAELQQQGNAGPTSALFCHWPHNGAGPAYRQRRNVRYPLDREISEVLLQLPELQNIAGKRALILRGNGGASC